MAVEIKFSQSYLWLDSWILANIIQLSTQTFCIRFLNHKLDPGNRLFDQMIMAARSGVANIAEGTSRHSTSIETEMRLLDVARASIDELQGDFFNYLLLTKAEIWPLGNPSREAIWQMRLDTPQYSNDLLHDAACHILKQKEKFDNWVNSEYPQTVANALLILCLRVNRLLQKKLEYLLVEFRQKGGFAENMTTERVQHRRQQARDENAPNCPKCGRPMLRRMQTKGTMQGREFWGCSDYPRCNGTLPIAPK